MFFRRQKFVPSNNGGYLARAGTIAADVRRTSVGHSVTVFLSRRGYALVASLHTPSIGSLFRSDKKITQHNHEFDVPFLLLNCPYT